MRWSLADLPDQEGRVALITGANSGLGLEAARALARAKAKVLLACRSEARARSAMAQLLEENPSAQLEFVALDLASLASVGRAAAAVRERYPRLDLLLNNAGLMATDPGRTEDGFEVQLGVNHLGHFALTAALLPALQAAGPGARVVNHASLGHRMGSMNWDDLMSERHYDRWAAYFQSKLANLLFTLALHQRLTAAKHPVACLCAHPGGSRTDLGQEGHGLTNRLVGWLGPAVTQDAAQGALPLLRAATDPSAPPGSYWGPRWWVWGLPVQETPSAAARRSADAERLWQRSVEWTGVEPLA